MGVLAAAPRATANGPLTDRGVTVLPVLDPVRVYEDFAQLDLVSGGRAELTVGRSAFVEPFALFGERLEDYDALFDEKLRLLLELRENERVSWAGRFRSPLHDAAIAPRALQEPLPVWVGVGGSPQSAARAGQLGLPMTLGLIGGPLEGARQAVELYRAAGERAGHPEKLKLGISTHFYAGADADEARRIYPYYHEYLRPKTPGGRGFLVSEQAFRAGTAPGQALMIGSTDEITAKSSTRTTLSAASTASTAKSTGAASRANSPKLRSASLQPRSPPPSAPHSTSAPATRNSPQQERTPR